MPSRSWLRRLIAAFALVATVTSFAPAVASPNPNPRPCTDTSDVARRITTRVDGQAATGRVAYPSSRPRAIVVVAHGYGHTTLSWDKHLRMFAKRGLVAVGMDYRGLQVSKDANGDGLPEARGFNVWKGSEDLIAAARRYEALCHVPRVILFSVSLGGNVGGIALARSAELERPGDNPLFDDWIDVEGEVNLIESSTEARLLAPVNEFAAQITEDLEEECGGTIEEAPQAYLERTVVARTGDIAAAGLRNAVVIHSIDDGLVPYDQAREIATLLALEGIATDMVTIGRRSPESERETTLTSYAAGQLDPDYTSPFAGHGSEKSTTHIVMVTAFERLFMLLGGDAPGPYREFFVDGEAGSIPS